MEKEHIDASLGLAFSLIMFERYRKNGLLQAEIQHVPGYRGRCKGFLHLVEGKVVSCYIEDKQNQRHQMSKETLIRVDKDRGPFEWTLVPLPAPPSLQHSAKMPSQPLQNAPIPLCIAPLNLERLEGWTQQQKTMLAMVYEQIDGQRDIEGVKSKVALPGGVTEEGLRVLLALKVITIIEK